MFGLEQKYIDIVKNILQKFVEHKKRLKSDKEENEKLKNALSGIERNDKK